MISYVLYEIMYDITYDVIGFAMISYIISPLLSLIIIT